jgi:hypothetical protein
VDDVIRLKTAAARSKDLDALSGLLRIARGRAGHHETRWEAVRRAHSIGYSSQSWPPYTGPKPVTLFLNP